MATTPAQTNQDPKPEIEKYRKALAADPDSRLFAALADSLRRSGDIKAAIAVAEQGVGKHPKYLSGIVVLAQAYFADQRYPDALELFKKVVKLNPENLTAHRAMAEIYDRIGDHEQALKAYRAITILDHTDKRAMERLQILEATMPRKAPAGTPAEQAPAAGREQEPAAKPAMADQAPAPEEAPAPTPEENQAPAPEEAPAESIGQAAPPGGQAQAPAPAAAEPFPKLPENLAGPQAEPPEPETGDQEITSPGTPPPEAAISAPPAPPPDDDQTLEIPPPSKPAAPPAAPGEDSMTDELPRPEPPGREADSQGPAEPSVEAAPAAQEKELKAAAEKKKALSEEEKLDLFFSGENLSRLGIAVEAEGFEVKGARDALSSPRDSAKTPAAGQDVKPGRSAPSLADVKITRSAMAKVFWNQGFRQKALAVLAGETCEKPDDPELRAEFEAACQAMNKDPDQIIAEAAPRADARPKEEKKEQPAEEPEQPEPEPEEPEPGEPEDDQTTEVQPPARDVEWFQPPVLHPPAKAEPVTSPKAEPVASAKAEPVASPKAEPVTSEAAAPASKTDGGDGGPRQDAAGPANTASAPGPARVQALRKYLDKIRGGKENKP